MNMPAVRPEGLEIVRAYMPENTASFAVALEGVVYDGDAVADCMRGQVAASIDDYLAEHTSIPLPSFNGGTLPGVNVVLLEPFKPRELALQRKIGFHGWHAVGGTLLKLEEIRVSEPIHHEPTRRRRHFSFPGNPQQELFKGSRYGVSNHHSPKHA